MKRIIFFIYTFVLTCMSLSADVSVPNIGNGRLRVCSNNLENYFFNYQDTDLPDYNTDEGRAEKTHKIVNMILEADADIYCFNELEANDIILAQLVDSINKQANTNVYRYVTDGYSWQSPETNIIKSGFVYRSDRVKTVGQSTYASSQPYYQRRMRVQVFEELSSGERFTLSTNHFKAKSTEEDKQKRVRNVTDLVDLLPSCATDPDILIVGDLNAQMDEDCISIIQNAGYTEQLLRFDNNAYSYCWNYEGELIDHVFANASMAEQITGAAVWHINTTCQWYDNYDYRYSDHDAYLVAMNLGKEPGGGDDDCEDIDFSETFASSLGTFTSVNVEGGSYWACDASYHYAKINAYYTQPDEDWLISPAFDFSQHKNGQINFSHTLGYGTAAEWPQQCMLLVSSDYTDDVAAANWTQLTIPVWNTTKWQWNDNSVNIPDEFMGRKNVYIAFKYNVQSSAPAWEIKNFTVTAQCDTSTPTNITETGNTKASTAAKVIENGKLYIIKNGMKYSVLGIKVE